MENRQLLAEKDAEIERLQGALAAGSGNAELDRLRQENTVLKRGMRIQWQQNKKLEDEVQVRINSSIDHTYICVHHSIGEVKW